MDIELTGYRIKTRREELGYTQEYLAIKINGDQSQIWNYEKGKRLPSAEKIILLARELETTADWLLGITDIKERPLGGTFDLDQMEIKLLELYRLKNPEQRDKLIELAKII